MRTPSAPCCSVHGVDCVVTPEDIANLKTPRVVHTHSEHEPYVWICPSACDVCKGAPEPKIVSPSEG